MESLKIKEKIAGITIDNAAVMKKATNTDFGIRCSCLAHILNLIVQNGLSLWKKVNLNEEAETSMLDENSDDLIENINEDCDFFEDCTKDNESDEESEDELLVENEDQFINQ